MFTVFAEVEQTIYDIKMEECGCWHLRPFMDWNTAQSLYSNIFDDYDTTEEKIEPGFSIHPDFKESLGISDNAKYTRSVYTSAAGTTYIAFEISDWENNHRGYISIETFLNGDWRIIVPEPF